ncbi:MAG: flagellar export chaperone FliS [Spirochaetales bacterium]|nr:flagellar export chaperone FliS [Spirochaetales bacterium]
MKNTDAVDSYKETQIKTATPGKLVIMLYEGAVKFINLALERMNDKHTGYEKVSNYIIKAQDIVTELMVSLDFDKGGQIAKNLFGLYLYMNRRLIEANIQKDTGILAEIKKLLTELRTAWIQASQKTQNDGVRAAAGSINIAG